MAITSERRRQLEKYVLCFSYAHVGQKTTVCVLTLSSGFEVVGTSAPVDVYKFDSELGKLYAKEDAFEALDKYMGVLEAHQLNKARGAFDVAKELSRIEHRKENEREA